jgi:hypothetical protein
MRKGIEEIKGNVKDNYADSIVYNGFPYNFYDLKAPSLAKEESTLASLLSDMITGRRSVSEIPRYYPDIQKSFSQNFSEKIVREITSVGAIERFPEPKTVQALQDNLSALIKQNFPSLKNPEQVVQSIIDSSIGYGFMAPLLRDPELEEIMVNSPQSPIFVFHRKAGMCKTNVTVSDDQVEKLTQKIAFTIEKKFDAENQLLDARLQQGERYIQTGFPAWLQHYNPKIH